MSVWFSESGPCALFEKGTGRADVVNYKAGMVRGAYQYVPQVHDGVCGPFEPTASSVRLLA